MSDLFIEKEESIPVAIPINIDPIQHSPSIAPTTVNVISPALDCMEGTFY